MGIGKWGDLWAKTSINFYLDIGYVKKNIHIWKGKLRPDDENVWGMTLGWLLNPSVH